jgi:hypothetical protein
MQRRQASLALVLLWPLSNGCHDRTTNAPQSTMSTIKDGGGDVASACSMMSLGANASLNGFLPFGATSAWNTDISAAPVDPTSATVTAAPGFAGTHLHHDFGSTYGIPYVVVDSSATPLLPVQVVAYPDESDVSIAPMPATGPIEGDPADCVGFPDVYAGDAHMLVVDRASCFLYETFNTHRCNGEWAADAETLWDLEKYNHRPWGWTSADAAGLSVMAGLVRYDEVAAGEIKHAIRFTMPHTKDNANGGYFTGLATHAAGNIWGIDVVMGMRVRLKADFDISGFSKDNQVILTAMKKYGMILADNGSYFFFQGAPDSRWNDADLDNLNSVQSSEFDIIEQTDSPPLPGYDSTTAPTGAAPTITTYTASTATVHAGTAVTLSWTATDDSYDFVDNAGAARNTITVTPTKTTTYTLNATNQFGRTTQALTVTVN